MLFTRQRSIAGQQVSNTRSFPWLALVSESVKNWSHLSICLSSVGNRCGQYVQPGYKGEGNGGGRKPSDCALTQNNVSMKYARKETGIPASDKTRLNSPLTPNNPEEHILFENQVFSQKPSPRQPEPPDVESLRSLLKANMSREKASPALLNRIRGRMQENKE